MSNSSKNKVQSRKRKKPLEAKEATASVMTKTANPSSKPIPDRPKRNRKSVNTKTDVHAKITEPLVAPTKRDKTTKSANGADQKSLKKRRLPLLGVKQDKIYTSVVHRAKPMFSGGSGASSRGGVSSDLVRFQIVWLIALLSFLALVVRAGYIQLINAPFYIEKGEGFITTTKTETAYRGMITDRNGLPLAVSAPLSTVVFSPHDYAVKYYAIKKELAKTTNPDRQAKWQLALAELDLTRLANASGMSIDRLKNAVSLDESVDPMDEDAVKAALPSGQGSHYLLLLKDVTPEIAKAVTELDFAGVSEEKNFKRYYPQAQPNAQLLGYMGENQNAPEEGYRGRAGIERQFESMLAGQDGKVMMLKNADRTHLKELRQLEPEVPGQDVMLTIDARMQYLLYKELEKVGRIQQARWATGMVVDVHTGEVLAMSTWPSFNNNDLTEMTGETERNRTVLDTFEPGSVMKPFTVAAALESKQYNINSLINTSPGVIRVKGYNIRDHGNLGTIGFATLLKKSSNVASTKIALSLPADGISRIQQQFGFGKVTGLHFPGEQQGVVPTPKDKETARRATLSYGYGLEVTLAQIAQAYATLGSGGVMHSLTLTKKDANASVNQRVISQKNALAIVRMLETVTEKGGTGTAAAIDGYRVAGKTGTSRRVNPEGGYYDDQYRTVFAGIAPASNPRLAAVILVEDPRENQYAGEVAAPVFKKVMQEALRLYNVPLDKPLPTRTGDPSPTNLALEPAIEESTP